MGLKPSIPLQPPVLHPSATLTVVISGMALGGAQWILKDWLTRIATRWRVHLVLLRDRDAEWQVPDGVFVTRLNHRDVLNRLTIIGQSLAASGNPVCVAHLLSKEEQSALEAGGAFVYQVFHNAQFGWVDQPSELDRSKPVIAVSYACKRDLIAAGWLGDISVIHHFPRNRAFRAGAREEWRKRWNIPITARVIGMIGSFKPQKDYAHALSILRALLDSDEEYYLVILGGLVGSRDLAEWRHLRSLIEQLGLRNRIAMPGPVVDAVQCAPAFDLFLNTSHYEGLSVAMLEILAAGIPAVVSDVGGQGEVEHAGLTLVDKTASVDVWANAITGAATKAGIIPVWSHFPAYRLWTLYHLTRPYQPSERVLFVTANLDIGGAQRSLVNVLKELDREQVSLAVVDESYVSDFYRELLTSGVSVFRACVDGNTFDSAETIVEYVTRERIGTIVYWNASAKLKLLLSKVLGHTKMRFVDVSPGAYAFESLEHMNEFGRLICYSTTEFYVRLDDLVLKYHGEGPVEFTGRVSVIPNGVPEPVRTKVSYHMPAVPKVAVCGRIAPSKFLIEILDAMTIVRTQYPDAELHIYGGSRTSEHEYVDVVQAHAGSRTIFHGPDFNAREEYCDHDVFVTLGRHQGCPNATLEALSVGMPIVANDDGGTREQVIDGLTGRLIATTSPEELAAAILSLLDSPVQAEAFGQAGRHHALTMFSMENMVERYRKLLWGSESLQQPVVQYA